MSIEKIRNFLVWMLGIWASSIGFRFIVGSAMKKTYSPALLDLFFDWGVLFVLGAVILELAVYERWSQRDRS